MIIFGVTVVLYFVCFYLVLKHLPRKIVEVKQLRLTMCRDVTFKDVYTNKFFVCLHGDKIYNSFVCGNTT